MTWFIAIVDLLKKVIEFITPWSDYWVSRRRNSSKKKEDALKKMDEAAKEGDADEYWDRHADRHSTD